MKVHRKNRGYCRLKLSLLWKLTVLCFAICFLTFAIWQIVFPATKTNLENHVKKLNFNRQKLTSLSSSIINQSFPNIIKYKTIQRKSEIKTIPKENKIERNASGASFETKLDSNLKLRPCYEFPRKYITIGMMGRLGNQMFEFASLIGIARKNGLCPVLPEKFSLRRLFNISIDTIQQHPSVSFTKIYKEAKGGCTFDPNALSLGNSKSIKLDGYFQSWRYFIDVSQDLRKMMTFIQKIRDKAHAEFHMLTSSYRKKFDGEISYVAVHVRRGDMIGKKEYVDYGYTSAPVHYIHEGMRKFRSILKNCLFVVGSDDIPWCKNNIVATDAVFLSSGNSAALDMAILAHCNHTLMTVGSFGWWTAWLINGKTIYFTGNPKPGSNLDKEFNSSDYRPHSWMGIF